MLTRLAASLVILALAIGALDRPAFAQAPPPPPGAPPTPTDAGQSEEVTPARLSYAAGSVSFWRPGADEWSPARMNTPLAPGDRIYAAGPATVEVQVGPQAFVRATDSAHVGLDNQDEGAVQLRLTAGQASIDVRGLEPGHTIELATPHAAFTVDRPGYYRIEVAAEASRFAVHRGGPAAIAATSGGATSVATGQEAVAGGNEDAAVEVVAARPLAEWDHWNETRTTQLVAAASARYVPPAVYGAEALDQHGSWSVVEPYGPVWMPATVPAGWVPYSAGRWIWDPRFGWTWLDDAPWGWAPYHYGRWVRIKRGWGWAPGPVVVRPVYAPALVVFLRPSVLRVGRPLYWAPLAWGEPVVPWWGRPGFIGVPTWAGWGGPRDVRHVVHRTTVHVSVYKHVSVTKAVVGVPAERFGRGGERPSRLETVDVQRLSRVAGGPDVRPAAASVRPAIGPAVKPPAEMASRTVVATRPPHDPAPALRRAGLPAAASIAPPTRVVRTRAGDAPSSAPSPGVSAASDAPRPQPPAAGRGAAPPTPQAGAALPPERRDEQTPPAASGRQTPRDARDARRPAPGTSRDEESTSRPPSSPAVPPAAPPRPGAGAAPHPAAVPPAARGAVREAPRDAGRDPRDASGQAASPPSDAERAQPRRSPAPGSGDSGAPPAVTAPTPPRGGPPSAAPPSAGRPSTRSTPAAPRPTAPGAATTPPSVAPPPAARPSAAPVAPSPRPVAPGDAAGPSPAAPPSTGRTSPAPAAPARRPAAPAAVAPPTAGSAGGEKAPAARRARPGDAGGPATESPAPAQRRPDARPAAAAPVPGVLPQRERVERAPRTDAPPRVERRPQPTPAAERPASPPSARSPEPRRDD